MKRKSYPLTCEKIHEYIKDESMGASEYMSHGLPHLAKDEIRHLKFMIKKYRHKHCKPPLPGDIKGHSCSICKYKR